MYILPALIPLLIGGIIALINNEKLNNATENIDAKLRRNKASNSLKLHWFRRFILKPLFYTFVKFFDWTSSIKHLGLRSGLRMAITLYLVIIWIGIIAFLAFMAIQVLIALFVLMVFWLIIRSWLENKGVLSKDSRKRPLANVKKDEVVNPENGEFEKEGFFGKEKTGRKIDIESGEIFEKGIFGWSKTGIKVDQKTGIIQEDGLFGYTDTELRINPQTGVIQKNELIGWIDTDYRINSETGKKQKKGIMGWSDL